ncbi:hypothetical protein L210DRAFT_954742 [Boletus edulis BED1]|uniref:Uncharacterized protein n=1 Tax=Boletus edulis BED1 TaxID=1328754 RepID=A0AAD4G798_BOLED|nr:hypothetical protein L210DRAFT_954742 [Boletus edulis BED1]
MTRSMIIDRSCTAPFSRPSLHRLPDRDHAGQNLTLPLAPFASPPPSLTTKTARSTRPSSSSTKTRGNGPVHPRPTWRMTSSICRPRSRLALPFLAASLSGLGCRVPGLDLNAPTFVPSSNAIPIKIILPCRAVDSRLTKAFTCSAQATRFSLHLLP